MPEQATATAAPTQAAIVKPAAVSSSPAPVTPDVLQCILIQDHHADPSTASDKDKRKIKYWFVEKLDPARGKIKVPVPYYPAGTVFEHDVIGFIMRGQASPANDFTAKACGLSPEELQQRQHRYRRQMAGIDPADFELFDAGVIVGYDKEGNYKPGPNWDAYQQSRKEAEAVIAPGV